MKGLTSVCQVCQSQCVIADRVQELTRNLTTQLVEEMKYNRLFDGYLDVDVAQDKTEFHTPGLQHTPARRMNCVYFYKLENNVMAHGECFIITLHSCRKLL